ncbi:DUF2855 family protein [Halopseudomonas salegens]|uniref:DUF2855 family protein n=1 Tax=Halopseudomonas salegens TaxID=1434072 RepID=A0A1H2ECL1_9GAMM|nr:DUF2855 family protein [Halopseudomonas salegens]SDT92754.1 Protein of unknown function [Halopseudomonas salegens]
MSAHNNPVFVVHKDDIQQTDLLEQPLLTAADLADGEALLAVDRFSFTANNITYAALGKRFQYWDFFPAPAPWGQIPVWGFADVTASRHPEIKVGTRVYGYLPMSKQLRVQPGQITDSSFVDISEHRSHLALAYNQYQFTANDPAYRREHEALQMLLRPLLITSFLLDDFLAAKDFFDADDILLTSASSKTALGLAFMLHHQKGKRDKPQRIVGLTSAGNRDFVAGLGYYDDVVGYDEIEQMDPQRRSVVVDFAGNSDVLGRIHQQFADNLYFSSLVGAAHWDQRGGSKELPGPAPEVFFAPGYWAQRAKESGNGVLMQQFAALWSPLVHSVEQWMEIKTVTGTEAIAAAYQDTLAGRVNPQQGLIMQL